jgi:hypothetical protein
MIIICFCALYQTFCIYCLKGNSISEKQTENIEEQIVVSLYSYIVQFKRILSPDHYKGKETEVSLS